MWEMKDSTSFDGAETGFLCNTEINGWSESDACDEACLWHFFENLKMPSALLKIYVISDNFQ
jgi:hypothetical protein